MELQNTLRIPPHSAEAERGLIGSILFDPERVLSVCVTMQIKSSSFFDRRHQTIFEQISDMALTRKAMDAITIAEWLSSKGCIDKVGGYDYLVQLQDSTVVSAHSKYYAEIVLQHALRRAVIEKATEAIDGAFKQDQDAETLLSTTRESFFLIGSALPCQTQSNTDAADKVIDRWERILAGEKFGLPWHIKSISDLFGNFQPTGNPYFLAAEPGGGKSVCMQNLHTHWSILGNVPTAIASLEMTHEKLIGRILAEQADISAWGLDNGVYGDGNHDDNQIRAKNWIEAAKRIKNRLSKSMLYINDRPMNTDELIAWGLAMYERNGIQALSVDYFQLINTPSNRKYEGLDAVKYNCGALQSFSKRTGVITLALSQITKLPTDTKGNPRDPRQDDLFGGRIIDAHSEGTVIFYKRDERDWATICKNRNGGCGKVEVKFNRPRLRFDV